MPSSATAPSTIRPSNYHTAHSTIYTSRAGAHQRRHLRYRASTSKPTTGSGIKETRREPEIRPTSSVRTGAKTLAAMTQSQVVGKPDGDRTCPEHTRSHDDCSRVHSAPTFDPPVLLQAKHRRRIRERAKPRGHTPPACVRPSNVLFLQVQGTNSGTGYSLQPILVGESPCPNTVDKYKSKKRRDVRYDA